MKITVLAENTTCDPVLQPEHGLSLYIETGDQRILFDAGQSGAFADNAQKLGVNLEKVDFAVLSHGHYDHGGGLARFRSCNTHAPIYIHPDAFRGYWHGEEKYIGLAPQTAQLPGIRLTGEVCAPAPGVQIRSCNREQRLWPADPFGLSKQTRQGLQPDDFTHEQYLLVQEQGKRILFSGCSHKGIRNILSWFRPDVCIGGFHVSKLPADGERLRQIGQQLHILDCQYYTGHCTGQAQFAALREILGNRLHSLHTGSTIIL